MIDASLPGAAVTSTGGQIYNGAVTLAAATTLTDTGGSAITFENTVDGAEALHVSTAGGTITLSGDVGAATPLGAVTLAGKIVALDASLSGAAISLAGTTGILIDHAGGAVASTGGQTYNGAVTLQAGTSLADSGGGTITFEGTVDGGQAPGSSVSASGGTIALSGNVGAGTALAAVSLSGGVVAIDASLSGAAISYRRQHRHPVRSHRGRGWVVTSTGGQTYAGPVTLQAVTLARRHRRQHAINFQNTVDGAQALTVGHARQRHDRPHAKFGIVDAALSAVMLAGAIVDIDAAISGGAITVTGTTGIAFDYAGAGAAVTSTGGQTYDGVITLPGGHELDRHGRPGRSRSGTRSIGTVSGGQALTVSARAA